MHNGSIHVLYQAGGTVEIVEPRGVVESGGGGTSGIDEARGGVL